MHKTNSLLRVLLRSTWSLRVPALVALAVIAANSMGYAQLAGTYTIGGAAPSYATIDAAITALSASGVSAPVTFLIRSGTYTPPAGGYLLSTYTGMSATNTVTFKPDAGATVTITGATSSSTAIFLLDGAKHYIFDGSNVVGGTSRDMTIRQTETTYNPAIWMKNDADLNVVKNCILQGNGGSQTRTSSATGIAIMFIGTTTAATGNDSNLVQNNLVGDLTGAYRSNNGIAVYGTSAKPNNGNRIIGNEVVNYGKSSTATGINIYAEQAGTVVDGNEVHMTIPSPVATIYGIYTDYSPGYPINSVFNGNRVYKLTSSAANWTIYGMYHWVSTASANSTITNNMISVGENGDHTIYGIYYQSSTGTAKFYHNSIYVGGTSTGTRNSYVLYKSAAVTIDGKNNIFFSERTGGTGSHYGVYISSTGGWTSNFSIIGVQTGSNIYTAYYSGARVTMADYRTASSQDANSFPANPRFIDPANGDLHISAVLATPVEGTGTPVGVMKDFDSQNRSVSTPDIGADEGTFTPSPSNDMAADLLITPETGGIVSATLPFTPVARILNNGTRTQTNVAVRYIIRNAASAIVYQDVRTVATILPFATAQVSFNQTGSVTGNTTLPSGTFTAELTTQLVGDQNVANDMISGGFIAKGPLSGIYTINKVGSGPRNFPSFTAAIEELTAVGVVGPVTFEVAASTYDASTETFPLRLVPVVGMSAVNTVTFKPSLGATVIVTGSSPASTGLFLIEGGKYYIFDGSNTPGGTTQNMTIRQTETTYNPAIWMRNDADFNVVKNCNLMGDAGSQSRTSSATGIGVIFIGTTTAATGNDSNLIQNNVVGDPTGAVRSNIGISIYGTSGKPNSGNRIIGNDVVNFGKSSTAVGINIYAEQAGTVVDGNEVHMSAPTSVATVYGIYTDYSPGYPINSVFTKNRIYKLTSSAANWTIYGMYHWVSIATANSTIANNMISVGEDGDHTIYGIYFLSSTGTANFHHNSIHVGGTATGTRLSYVLYKSGAVAINSINNIFSSSRTGTGTHYGTYISSTTGWLSRNNIIGIKTGGNVHAGYYGAARTTLAALQAASGQEANSVEGTVPFINPLIGNLHVNPVPVFRGEGTGATGLAGLPTTDFDGELRDVAAPDMGADEGDFNGGGLRIVTPNGGEKYSVDYELDVHFTANRPMQVRLEFSTDGGASWMPRGTADVVTGPNVVTVHTPNTVTSQALVRVISQKNMYEADTSDAAFELVLPIFTIQSPNGGEKLVPTDTVGLKWNALYTPPSMRLQLDLSTDNGASWTPIDTNVYVNSGSEDNVYNWIVPNIQTDRAIVRVKVAGGNIRDISNAVFTILPMPYVSFVQPADRSDLYVGETSTIRWDSETTQNVRLDYSTDGGLTWAAVVNNGVNVPAFMAEYPWVVPGTPSMDARLKITNAERPRFSDTLIMTIRASGIMVLSPNGGERYEQAQPVLVSWMASEATSLRIDYSSDNGSTWQMMASSIDPALGSYVIHPPAVPTKAARVRIVDAVRSNVWDVSDGMFEIMQGKHIVVHTPATGDELTRNRTAVISWSAPRIDRVNLSYSMDNGNNWQLIANNVQADQGSMVWTTPSQLSNQVKIRIQEAGGTTIGETGVFRIVEQSTASVRILTPNGGETYTVGDVVTVRWSASGANQPFRVAFLREPNGQWEEIGMADSNDRSFDWTITSAPGKEYRVRVVSGELFDASDANFTVNKVLNPSITVLYPNGGENFMVDSMVQIKWSAIDVQGQAVISLSTDDGNTWNSITSTDVNNGGNNDGGTFPWKVPNQVTTKAKIKVTLGVTEDKSDAAFRISAPTLPPVVVKTPNGGEEWKMGETRRIEWDSPEGVSNVDIEYSTNGGAEPWMPIVMNRPSLLGTTNWYDWTVPTSTTEYRNTVLIRIRNSANPTAQQDLSNAPFSILFGIAGVENGTAGLSSLRLLGNYPNPFAGRTEIRWEQGKKGAVEIRVYQQNGTLVSYQNLGNREVGEQRYDLQVDGLASGAYIYEVRVAGESQRSVMMVVR